MDDDRSTVTSSDLEFDVVVIGAGISGINTAYHLQQNAKPAVSYTILEGRDRIGGTWDLFRYPGIRSDSDIYSFGFAWNTWSRGTTLATGPEILSYMQESASKFGIDKKIRFRHKVISADWSSKQSLWTLKVEVDDSEFQTFHARFIVLGTGYYDYKQSMQTTIPGINNFAGRVIQPQFWPEDLDYTGKDVVIIGSGATAVTLLPNIARDAKHVTMLQRSPTYIAALPMHSRNSGFLQAILPTSLTREITRALWILRGYYFYYFCRLFPETAKLGIQKAAIKQLPPNIPHDPHFKPRYNPWDQRFCASPDGDFFAALRSYSANVVTDTIQNVTEKDILLTSGATLHPDIIVAATGLKLLFAGGIKLSVDGQAIDPSAKFAWRGCMLQDVPNLLFIAGYTNASWTLGAEVAAVLFTRLLALARRKGFAAAIPRAKQAESMIAGSFLDLQSTYLRDVNKIFPKVGQGQWASRWNYVWDMLMAKYGSISKDVEFVRGI